MNEFMHFNFELPTKFLFGAGKLKELHKEQLPGTKALLLTSSGRSVYQNGAFDTVVDQLKISGKDFVHFCKIEENPLKEHCEEAGRFAYENGCDFIVAVGGGAVLDSAVAIAILATNDADLWDFAAEGTGKGLIPQNDPLPIVTVATTSGTGSELNEWGVISNAQTREKMDLGDARCKPVISVVDPEYMKSVPPYYTACQGFDALFHHTEVMMSKDLNILSETLALSAIENIVKYLPLAIEDGNNIEARERVAYASSLAGITMNLTNIVAQHSIEHAMSAYHRNLPHGVGLILISKEFAQFFIDRHICDERFIKMAKVMGYPQSSDPQDFILALEQLKQKCGVDGLKMSDYQIVYEECSSIAKAARKMQGSLYECNPCAVTDQDITLILEKSYR